MFIYKPNKTDKIMAQGMLITKDGLELDEEAVELKPLVDAGILKLEKVDKKALEEAAKKEREEAEKAKKEAEKLAKEAEEAKKKSEKEEKEAQDAEEKVSNKKKK